MLQSVERVLAAMGPSPAAFVRRFDPRHDGRAFEPLVHRWTRGDDLAALMLTMRRMMDEAGSIEAFFLLGHDTSRTDVEASIESFSTRALALAPAEACRRPTGVPYFFPRPSTGSACKRLNLYLRWMVRRDAVDFGAWSGVSPSQLIVPLDVHVIRLGQCLELDGLSEPGLEDGLRHHGLASPLDPADPVRYDFALCHVGMRDQCGFNRPSADARCPLRGWCRPRRRTRRASPRPSGRR